MEKICTKCGNVYSKDIKFCVRCGSNLIEKKIEPVPPNGQSSSVTPQQEIQTIKPSKTVKFKKAKPMEKMVIPVLFIALILSVAAILLPITIPEDNLASNSVGPNQIANNSVTGEKILDGSISNDDISNFGLSKFALNSVTSQIILDGTIQKSDLSNITIQELTGLNVIENNSITGDKIANGTIDTVDIKNNTITNSDIATDAIDTEELVDNAVTYAKMSIKIKYGTKPEAFNGTVVTHGLGSKPSSVIVTPVYDASVLGGNYVIYANVHNINSNSFTVGLWYLTFTSPPVIYEISGTPFIDGVSVNWIAIL